MAKLIVESKGTMVDGSSRYSRVRAARIRSCSARRRAVRVSRPLGRAAALPWKTRRRRLCRRVGIVRAGTIGAQFVREIERGEIVRIGADGLDSYQTPVEDAQPALCVFEYIYFARPDSQLNERSVYMARYAMGRQLAQGASRRRRRRDGGAR